MSPGKERHPRRVGMGWDRRVGGPPRGASDAAEILQAMRDTAEEPERSRRRPRGARRETRRT